MVTLRNSKIKVPFEAQNNLRRCLGNPTLRAQRLKKINLDWTLRAQILKKIKILKFSSELEIFKRATHQTPIFCGEFWRSGLKISSEIEIFKRDWNFQAILKIFKIWAFREIFNLAWKFQSRLKFSIPDLQNSPPSPPHKNRVLVGGLLENFNLDWNFQSWRAILNIFNLWALRALNSAEFAPMRFESHAPNRQRCETTFHYPVLAFLVFFGIFSCFCSFARNSLFIWTFFPSFPGILGVR